MRRMPPGLVLLVPLVLAIGAAPTLAQNSAPVAIEGHLTTPTGTTASGTLTASDEDGDPLVYRIVSPPAKGTLTLTDPAAGTFTIEVVSNVLMNP